MKTNLIRLVVRRRGILLAGLSLASFAFLPAAPGVNPPPDGGYAGNNTAEGTNALFSLTSGTSNTALGYKVLFSTTTGDNNTAVGTGALRDNIGGSHNTAVGVNALFRNKSIANTATGFEALFSNTTGIWNTADGFEALLNNTTGLANTAAGFRALENNVSGSNNTALGYEALLNNTGNSNIAVGLLAGASLTSGDSNIDIGNGGVAGESDTIRIGAKGTHTSTFIAGISGSTVANGVGVIVGTGGKLGTIVSSARFKEKIRPMDKASEALLQLKPVSFNYKKELDPNGIPQFGLVAEEVAKVDPDLVVRGEDGQLITVRYEAVNAMLLNEFLKEHGRVAQQQKEIDELRSAVKEQAAQIQRVSAQVAVQKSAEEDHSVATK